MQPTRNDDGNYDRVDISQMCASFRVCANAQPNITESDVDISGTYLSLPTYRK